MCGLIFLLISDNLRTLWIIGHSFVFWTKKRAERRVYGSNLGLPSDQYSIHWFGKRGMHWTELHDTLSFLHGQWPVPRIVILHLSGNDIGHITPWVC